MGFSCIIPAYNEGPRVAKILETVLSSDQLDEVIVINDGSVDNTREEIEKFSHPKLKKIHLDKNQGKIKAFFIGINNTSNEYIFMLDADLIGLQAEDIETLIRPVYNGERGSTMTMWHESLAICKFLKHDIFSGTRILPRSVFDNQDYFLQGYGFGLEARINEILFLRNVSVLSIYFPHIHNPYKGLKQILWRQPRDILRSMPLWKIIRQAWFFYRQQP